MAKKRKKRKRIGEMTQTRGTWDMNPVTRVKESKKRYNRNEEKRKSMKGDY